MDFLLTASFWHMVLSGSARVDPSPPNTGIVREISHPVRVPLKTKPVPPPTPALPPVTPEVVRMPATPLPPVIEPVAEMPSVPVETENQDIFGERVVVIAPHPDDEILCCSRTLADRIESGAEVSIIFLTDGDARVKNDWDVSRKYGSQRRAESSAAARKMGIPQENLYFFGFPDGYLDEILARGQARSEYTGRRAAPRSTAYPGVTYTRHNLERILNDKLADLNPDEIFVPSMSDSHPDHQAAAELVAQVVPGGAMVRGYAVHGIAGAADTELDSEKLKLIQLFKTQRHDGYHVRFLEKFASIRERFEQVVASR